MDGMVQGLLDDSRNTSIMGKEGEFLRYFVHEDNRGKISTPVPTCFSIVLNEF